MDYICESCGRIFKSQAKLDSHVQRTHKNEEMFNALKEMREIIDRQRSELAERKKEEAEKKEIREVAKLERQAADNFVQKITESKKRYESEPQIDYVANDDGLDITINHYRVIIPPNTVGKIPESFLPNIKQRFELKRKAVAFATACSNASKDKDIDDIGRAIAWAKDNI